MPGMGPRSPFVLAFVTLVLAACAALQPVPPSFLAAIRERAAEFTLAAAPPDVMKPAMAIDMADERHRWDAGTSGAQPAPSLVYGLIRCVDLPSCRLRAPLSESTTIKVWLAIYPDGYWVASDARTGKPVISSTGSNSP